MRTTARLAVAVVAASTLLIAGCSTGDVGGNTQSTTEGDRITPQSYGVSGLDVVDVETPKGVLVECVRVFTSSIDCDWEGADRTDAKDPIGAIDR